MTTTIFNERNAASLKGKTMHKRLFKSVLCAAAAITPLALMPNSIAQAQSTIAPAGDLVISIGRGELVNIPGTMADVFVANEGIADVQVKSQRQLYVFGLGAGETTIYASNAAGDIIWSANVRVGSNIDSIDQLLDLAMPEANIRVATMGANTVLLTGTVAAPEDAAEAERLVSAFTGEATNVISRLKMATPLQVNLRVRFAEVNRSLARNLGTNLTSIDGSSGFKFGIGQGRAGAIPQFWTGDQAPLGIGQDVVRILPDGTEIPGTRINPLSPGTTLGAVTSLFGLDIAAALDLGEREGLVTTLSEPNLTALSGETAEFLAGGEFPIPLSQGLGTTTVEYKNFGVSLAYTPTVLANGRISIRVAPEVSELSTQGAVQLDGFTIPALTIRRAETTVELGSGESFMIAGLLSSSASNTVNKAPGAGDIPILGSLFRSTEFQRGETELVIVVTPYLVKPVTASHIRLPTDGYASPNADEQFLLHRDSAGRSGAIRPMPRAAGDSSAAPEVSVNAQDGKALAEGERPAGRNAQNAEAARPGFSLK